MADNKVRPTAAAAEFLKPKGDVWTSGLGRGARKIEAVSSKSGLSAGSRQRPATRRARCDGRERAASPGQEGLGFARRPEQGTISDVSGLSQSLDPRAE